MRPLFHPTPPKWCQRCEDFSGANRSNRWLVPDVPAASETAKFLENLIMGKRQEVQMNANSPIVS